MILKPDFSRFRVGDRINNHCFGNGTIQYIHEYGLFVVASFDEKNDYLYKWFSSENENHILNAYEFRHKDSMHSSNCVFNHDKSEQGWCERFDHLSFEKPFLFYGELLNLINQNK